MKEQGFVKASEHQVGDQVVNAVGGSYLCINKVKKIQLPTNTGHCLVSFLALINHTNE